MNYTIQRGDCLWNIAKTQYKLTSNAEIAKKVQEIAKDNNIENPDLIYADSNLVLNGLDDDTEDTSLLEKFDTFTNSEDSKSTFEYANSTDTQEDIAKKALEFAETYINSKGNNDGNIDLNEFINNNPELKKEDAEAVYKMIDMDGKDGITKDEYAAYLMTIDFSDGKLDGSMNVKQFNTVGAETAVLAQDKYAGGQTQELNTKAKQGLNLVKQIMQHFSSKYFASSLNAETPTTASTQDETSTAGKVETPSTASSKAEEYKNYLNNAEQNNADFINGKDNEFQMFNFNPSTYSSDLKNFAKETIKLYDTNNDGQLDVNEYIKMMYGDKADSLPENLKKQIIEKFASISNFDTDASKLSAEELATEFLAMDVDWSKYDENQDLTNLLDGKFKYSESLAQMAITDGNSSALHKAVHDLKKDFYNNLYGKTDAKIDSEKLSC